MARRRVWKGHLWVSLPFLRRPLGLGRSEGRALCRNFGFWSKFDGRVLRGQEKIFEDPAGALWAEERKRWLVRSSGGGTCLGRVLAVRAGRRI